MGPPQLERYATQGQYQDHQLQLAPRGRSPQMMIQQAEQPQYIPSQYEQVRSSGDMPLRENWGPPKADDQMQRPVQAYDDINMNPE